jgi:hypothetical protein
MNAKTGKALAELGQAAARHAGIPDDQLIEMSVCHDREYEWCGLVDGEPIESNQLEPDSKPSLEA